MYLMMYVLLHWVSTSKEWSAQPLPLDVRALTQLGWPCSTPWPDCSVVTMWSLELNYLSKLSIRLLWSVCLSVCLWHVCSVWKLIWMWSLVVWQCIPHVRRTTLTSSLERGIWSSYSHAACHLNRSTPTYLRTSVCLSVCDVWPLRHH